MKLVFAAAPALMLLACAPQEQGEVFTFACSSGKTFSVSYDDGATLATVKSGAATYKLPAVISGSGARYSDGKVEFWEHGGEAMLNGTPAGDSGSCPMRDPA